MKKIVSLVLLVGIMVSAVCNTYASTYDKQVFSDVPINHWAYPYISEMVERGVISGYDDGTFQPDKPVTRAEAAKMMASIANVPKIESSDKSYNGELCDIPKDSWYAPYIRRTQNYFNKYELKVSGKTKQYFHPDDYAEREDIIVAVIKQYYGFSYNENDMIIERAPKDNWEFDNIRNRWVLTRNELEYVYYIDSNEITEVKKPYIERALSIDLLNGYDDNTLRPHGTVTRAEMATLLYKLYGIGNVKDIVLGNKNYKIDCTIDEFVSRYNKNVKDNAKNIQYDPYKNFIIEELYINKATFLKAGTGENNEATIYGNVKGNSKFYVNNISGKIVEVDWTGSNSLTGDTRINGKGVHDFERICFLMSIFNISYQEAETLFYVTEEAPFFSRGGNTFFLKEGGALCVLDLSLTEHVDFGVYIKKQNSGKNIETANCEIKEFISKYNARVSENFKYLQEDFRFVVPEILFLHEGELIGKLTSAKDIYKYSVEYGSDFYGYSVNKLQLVCNTKNEILSIKMAVDLVDDGEIANTSTSKLDRSNLGVISVIQAIEDISYEEAKRYYFSVLDNRGFTSAKGNIYEKEYGVITIISSEYYSYLSDLSYRYTESLTN